MADEEAFIDEVKPAKKKPAEDAATAAVADRKEQLGELPEIIEQTSEIYDAIVSGFDDKDDQNTMVERCWDVYNCVLNSNQAYYGVSQVYVPIVKDAVEARVTRYCNELFPSDRRYTDVVSTDDQIPYEVISLMDHYVGRAKLRSNIGPSLIRMGDVTGQYSVLVDWNKCKRFLTKRVQRSEFALDEDDGTETEIDLDIEDSKYEDVEDETIVEGNPGVTVLDPRDLLVLPATVDTIEEASIIAIAMRLSAPAIKQYIKRGIFDKDKGENLLGMLNAEDDDKENTQKQASNDAGVRLDGKGNRIALVYQAWSVLKISEDEERMCVTYFGHDGEIIGCTRNPYWNDKVPVISTPALKVAGSFWGKSRIAGGVEAIQYAANDACNMGFDSAQYALCPIVMTDPEKNPRVGSMVLAMAAIWETNPNDTQFAEFPPVWKDAFSLVNDAKEQVQQSMSTNPAMMPNGAGYKKPTQAQIVQEQQVALEGTADVVNSLEDGVFSPMLQWFYDLDYQFRDAPLMVKKFGPLGYYALMEEVPPLQSDGHYTFSWYGSQGSKDAQMVQQQIAAMNVFRGITPDQLDGRKLDLGPLVDHIAKTAFGPRLAPKVIVDKRHQMAMDPELENQLLSNQFLCNVSPDDNDIEHIQAHQQAMHIHGDPEGFFRAHIIQHTKSLAAKQQAQQAAMQPQGAGGPPMQAGPGGPPQPQGPAMLQPGAQPAMQRNVQNPPGAIHPDNMASTMRMPA